MNKKASLKDAFVKNMESGAGNRDTASHTPVYPGSQAAGKETVSANPPDPAILQAGSLYTQPHSSPSIQQHKKKATFNLDAALHQRLKIAAAMHSREMVDIVQDALQAYLPVLDRKVG